VVLKLWKCSELRACERAVIRTLSACIEIPAVHQWCADLEAEAWGHRRQSFTEFVARFFGDWDCDVAARRVAYVFRDEQERRICDELLLLY
jgi:hypothetical protein